MKATDGKRTIIRKTAKFIISQTDATKFTKELQTILPISPFFSETYDDLTLTTGTDQILNNSIYFDSDDLCMYDGRVSKLDKADLYRTRWYGSDKQKASYFLERKRHRDTTISGGKQSSKKRVLMCSKPEEQDYKNLQKFDNRMIKLQLKPKVRTQYYRTSFMAPNEMEGVRITLDENIVISDANNYENDEGGNRCYELPFAVIEVKISVNMNNAGEQKVEKRQISIPQCLLNVIANSNGKKMKVSKFNTGCCLLYPSKIKTYP
eukprot:Pgem_evm1s7586